jgi:hypothetical protein
MLTHRAILKRAVCSSSHTPCLPWRPSVPCLELDGPRAAIAVLEQKVAEWKAELTTICHGHASLEERRLGQLKELEELHGKLTELQQLSPEQLVLRGGEVANLPIAHAQTEYAAYQTASASLSAFRLTDTIKELAAHLPLDALMQNLLTWSQVGQLKELFGDTPIVRV